MDLLWFLKAVQATLIGKADNVIVDGLSKLLVIADSFVIFFTGCITVFLESYWIQDNEKKNEISHRVSVNPVRGNKGRFDKDSLDFFWSNVFSL
jgi:hypothetical protein